MSCIQALYKETVYDHCYYFVCINNCQAYGISSGYCLNLACLRWTRPGGLYRSFCDLESDIKLLYQDYKNTGIYAVNIFFFY